MQAVILAAGMGRRLKELTADNTKCMLDINGRSLIQRALEALEGTSVTRVVIVAGYKGEALKDYVYSLGSPIPIQFIDNPEYATTNNIYSLYLAKDILASDDTLLLESDLIFDPQMLKDLEDSPFPNLVLAARFQSWMDGTVVTLDAESNITSFVDKHHFDFSHADDYYKTVNIYKFSRDFSCNQYIPFLEAYSTALGRNQYYEQVLKVITLLDNPNLKGLVTARRWYEIDDAQDKEIAETLFEEDAGRRYERICHRFGGFWRFPGLLDFCYLVNPYFPTRKMRDELKYEFDELLTQYPSGQAVNALVAGKTFAVAPSMIAVGNGAAEFISSLARMNAESIFGLCLPSFEEYNNRIPESNRVQFFASAPAYTYTADDLIGFFNDKRIDFLIIVNPDNPSGSYIDRAGLMKLLEWTERKGVRMVLDESFADFSHEGFSAVDQELLKAHPSLIVIKSISKSYGIPGARLGIMCSGDQELIAKAKKDISIWNINSFGEYALQILEKHLPDYRRSLVLLQNERARFTDALSRIDGLRVIPSQANYVMVEVLKGTSRQLATYLLENENILVKDLSTKTGISGQYLRIAVRDENDDKRLVEALSAYFSSF